MSLHPAEGMAIVRLVNKAIQVRGLYVIVYSNSAQYNDARRLVEDSISVSNFSCHKNLEIQLANGSRICYIVNDRDKILGLEISESVLLFGVSKEVVETIQYCTLQRL